MPRVAEPMPRVAVQPLEPDAEDPAPEADYLDSILRISSRQLDADGRREYLLMFKTPGRLLVYIYIYIYIYIRIEKTYTYIYIYV